MRAVWYERNGNAEDVLVVGEMADPRPRAGEVRVRLAAAGVNPSDVKSRAGTTRKIAFPRVIPCSDGAGVIDRLGTGVPRRRLGERVWVFNGQWQRPFGTSAQYITLPADQAVPLPRKVGFAEGACLGIPVMTAHRCVFADGPVKGRTVLVTGGAGVVGHYAIQLARWGGARVIATVSSPEKARHARRAGADHVVNYRSEDVAARVARITRGAGVDRIVEVDFGANLPVSQQVLKVNGVIATYASMTVREPALPFYPLMFANTTIRAVLVYNMPEAAKRQAQADIARWLARGKPQFAIAARFPLARAVEAHQAVEAGAKIGHVVLEID
jgi:NADPH2:quinone reductase